MTATFVTLASAPVGSPIHVTVYDATGNPIDPGSITWSGLPASITATPDGTGFNFEATAVAAASVTAHDGVALGSITLSFTAPPLKFSNP